MPWGQGGGGGGGGGGWGWGGDGGGVTNIIHAVISGITEVVAGGVLRADKASYDDTTAGWWLGRDPDDAVSKLHFGDAVQYLRWTGSALELAGSIGGFITDLVIATAGAIRSGKTLYDDDTAGWWIGYDDATEPSAPRINLGDATYYLKWTGTALEIVGAIGGAITDLVMATNGAIRSGKTGPTDTTPGWWIGEQFGTPKFNVGDDEEAIAWNGSYLSILGRIGGEISELVVSSLLGGVFRSGKTSFSDFVNSGWWIGWDDGSPALNIGNDEAFLTFHPDQIPPVQYKWTGAYIDPATLPGSALEDGAVDSTQIASGAVTSSKIGSSAVGSTALASGAVTSSKIASGAVTALALATGAVGSSALASNAVTSGKIASAAVTADKLSVAALEDVSANTGTLDISEALRLQKTGPTDTTAGAWLGLDSGTPKLNVGDGTNYLKFDGVDTYIKSTLLTVNNTGVHLRRDSGSGQAMVLEDDGYDVATFDGYANTGEDTNQASLVARGYASGSQPDATLTLGARNYDNSKLAYINISAITGSAGYISLSGDWVSLVDNFLEVSEISDPSAPSSNHARLYCRDNGSGKTQLCVRFSSGAVQVLATEP